MQGLLNQLDQIEKAWKESERKSLEWKRENEKLKEEISGLRDEISSYKDTIEKLQRIIELNHLSDKTELGRKARIDQQESVIGQLRDETQQTRFQLQQANQTIDTLRKQLKEEIQRICKEYYHSANSIKV